MQTHSLLGQILATVAVGAIEAGAIATNPVGALANPAGLASLFTTILQIWDTHTTPTAVTPAPVTTPSTPAAA
jgi:hypothetical protein